MGHLRASSGSRARISVRVSSLGLGRPCKHTSNPPVARDVQTFSERLLCASKDPNVVCVGGINRMSSQQQRGGGTVCFIHAELHTYMRSLIKTTQDCDVLPSGTPLKMLAAAKTGRTKPATLRIGSFTSNQEDLRSHFFSEIDCL